MLARFERLMEQAIEGSLRRVFPTSLQPIQLAKAAARAMEQAEVVGVHGREVPNAYELRIASADLERFGDYRENLLQEIRTFLVEYARERGLRPAAEIRVDVQADAHVRVGNVEARARYVGLTPQAQHAVDEAASSTRRLRLADLEAAQAARSAPVPEPRGGLRLTDGRRVDFGLDAAAGVVRLGRALDNDVVVDSGRVSRYHTQLRWVDSGWLVYDLGSTNGTWVNDERVQEGRPLMAHEGNRLRLGDYELQVVRERARRRGSR